jgi:hypothetical protein
VSLQTDVDSVTAFGTRQLNAQVMTSVNEFKDGWNVALAIFGLHLLVLGYLVFKSNYIPSVLGILVMIASVGYLIDSFGGFLSASYDANVAMFTFPGRCCSWAGSCGEVGGFKRRHLREVPRDRGVVWLEIVT